MVGNANREWPAEHVSMMDMVMETGKNSRTVELALRGYPLSSGVTGAIEDTAIKIGYHERKSAWFIGMIVPDHTLDDYCPLVSSLVKFGRSYQFNTHIIDSVFQQNVEKRAAGMFNRSAIGVFLIDPIDQRSVDHSINEEIPITVLNIHNTTKIMGNAGTVNIDHKAGAYAAMNHLLERGHEKIAYLAGIAGTSIDKERINGFEDALFEKTHTPDTVLDIVRPGVIEGLPDMNTGYVQGRQLFRDGQMVDAVLTYNNAVAIGAMRAIRETGRKVPDDLSVVVLDDTRLIDAMCTPSLTGVWVQTTVLAWTALALLFNQSNTSLNLKPYLYQGKSVR